MAIIARIGLIVILLGGFLAMPPQSALAASTTITFESGVDGTAIGSTISGLTFSAGWTYGDWRSARYNGKYPAGDFTGNGNVFAWLGQSQIEGRIDFVEGNASYFQVKVSAGATVTLKGYDGFNNLRATASVAANVNTDNLATLRIDAPNGETLHHVTLSGSANTWIIDDLETDAGSLPSPVLPVILIPGVGGSHLVNDHNLDGIYDQVWLNIFMLMLPGDDAHLVPTHLQGDGNTPANPGAPEYFTLRAGDILRSELTEDIYQGTINFFLSKGYIEGQNLIICSYDWRRDLRQIAYNYNPSYPTNSTLDQCVNYALARNPDARKVNILAHSMGGMVARTYLIDPLHAAKVKHLVTLGTPYFGASKVSQMVLAPEGCFLDLPVFGCNPNPSMTYSILQNFPSGYQLAPGEGYFMVYPGGFLKRWGAYLNYNQSMDQFRAHNTYLTDDAIALRQLINMGYSGGSENGVDVWMFIGYNLPTPYALEEKSYGQNSYNMIYGDGDATVPIHSASMSNDQIEPPVDLSADAELVYVNGVDHGDLPKHGGILNAVYTIFTSSKLTAEEVTQGSSSLSTQSTGLSGRVIQIDGPVLVRIYDAQGNLTGPDAGQLHLVKKIPGLFYQVNDTDSVILKLPAGGEYRIELQGTRSGTASLRVWNYEQDALTRAIQYSGLSTSTSSLGLLVVKDDFLSSPPPLLQKDGQKQPVKIQPEIIPSDDPANQ
ncbi:MAG TPA: alpha/beta fold hydrolase [Anaerolineaceae bacterium]|nr:alpha/beta fold hydrolase [Anaerolineaceae bacterium]